jgi:hypothetical protein
MPLGGRGQRPEVGRSPAGGLLERSAGAGQPAAADLLGAVVEAPVGVGGVDEGELGSHGGEYEVGV